MEGSGDGSPQSSMCMVKAAELFPKPVLEKEEEKLTVRFNECKYSHSPIFFLLSINIDKIVNPKPQYLENPSNISVKRTTVF